MKLIGSKFEINSLLLKRNNAKLNFDNQLSSGKAALYVIFRAIKEKNNRVEILLSDYLCKSIAKTIKDIELKFNFYAIDKKLHLNRNYFEKIVEKGYGKNI